MSETMTQKGIIIKQMQLGLMENYIYFIGCAQTREIGVVDPGWDVPFIKKEAQQNGYNITAILLTHGHPDHVEGVEALLKYFDVPVYISALEADFYMPECKNLKKTTDKEIIRIGKIEVECIHAPGHTPGCQCYRAGNILLTGDVLFTDGCGRCDLSGSSAKAMYHSLYNIIMKLPDTMIIYPGHNYGQVPFATLGELKKTNSLLRCENEKYFVTRLTGFGL